MANIGSMFKAHLSGSPARVITGSLVSAFVRSPFALWCQLFAPAGERMSLTAFQGMLFEQGQQHETDTIDEDFHEAVHEQYATQEEGFRLALEMMERGEAEIQEMPLISLPNGIYGKPDVLKREGSHKSIFGGYHYEVVEIKLATNIRLEHYIQAALYTRLIGLIQEFTPDLFHIVNGDGEMSTHEFAEFAEELDDAIDGSRAVLTGKSAPAPCFNATPWPWSAYGDKLAIEKHDVSLIPGVGPAMQPKMMEAGFHTVEDIAGSNTTALQAIKGIGLSKAKMFLPKAKALSTGQPVRLDGPIDVTQSDLEIFLDLEGAQLNGQGLSVTNYLIGATVRSQGDTTYHPFFAETPDKEEEQLRAFCEFVGTLGDVTIYHWHNYEQNHLSKMMAFYGFKVREQAMILDRLVDLHPIATKAFAFPSYGDTLKGIARALGFEWQQGDIGALETIVLYQQFLDSGSQDKDMASRILIYNEDDCLATMHIKDWLVAQTTS